METYFSMSPVPSRTIPAPLPFMLDVPSTYNARSRGVSLSTCELNSATKFFSACDLMLSPGTYWMSYYERSTAQDTILPAKSSFFKIWKTLVFTGILWPWKYGINFLTERRQLEPVSQSSDSAHRCPWTTCLRSTQVFLPCLFHGHRLIP